MTLTPEQKAAVATWVAAGANLSLVQKRLADEFKIALTYRDVRFLVDDLDLALKDPAPKVDTSDVSKPAAPTPPAARAEKKGFLDKAKEKLGLGGSEDELPPGEEFADEGMDDLPPAAGNVTVEVDKVTLIPGALASGSVTFSDGVTGKWIVDHQGRPGFTQVSQPGYRPAPEDAQAFMQELSRAFQARGM
ncbi:MAG TPA: hypothetical protein PKY38_11640 [Opitutaceae bacterium]|nr:hypothetical protein [Opitutaceae bacterium]